MKNQVTIEKKFTVAGIEFDNLQVARFFARAIELETQYLSCEGKNKFDVNQDLLDNWYTMLSYSRSVVEPEIVVAYVMALQLPKPARKKKETKFRTKPNLR